MNALVYVEHRPGHSLGKKSDEDLQCSPQSWLDDFMQHRPGHSLGKQLDEGMGINFFSKSDSVLVIDNENKSH